ncbi:MAG: TonB-dependent receptor, partial [Burkholderiaceae bacterium]|nr:TonB-dependent receptor [Burkholderiaceae bacterium]
HLRNENYNVGDADIRYADDKAVARLTWRVSPALAISNELAYMKASRNWRHAEYYVYDPAAKLVERSDYIAIRHDHEQTANRLDARWNAGANQLAAGWESATINFQHTNNSPYGGSSSVTPTGFNPGVFDSPDPLRPNFATDTTTHALYLEDAYRLNQQWLLLAGARHDRYQVQRVSLLGAVGFTSTLNSNAVRLGLTWMLAPHAGRCTGSPSTMRPAACSTCQAARANWRVTPRAASAPGIGPARYCTGFTSRRCAPMANPGGRGSQRKTSWRLPAGRWTGPTFRWLRRTWSAPIPACWNWSGGAWVARCT